MNTDKHITFSMSLVVAMGFIVTHFLHLGEIQESGH